MNDDGPRGLGWAALIAVTVVTYTVLLAPILVVLVEAFNPAEIMSFPPEGVSLRWFVAFFAHRDFMSSLRLSTELALASATIATGIGTMAGLALARARPSTAATTLLLSPLYVPRVLIGLSLLLVFAALKMTGSFAGLLLGHVLLTVPYVVRTVWVGASGIERAVEEAARVLGATPWEVFRRVTLPLLRAPVLAGFVFALIVSFSDIYLALFISGPETNTLPLRMFTFMEWDQSPLVAAAAAVQIVLILAVVILAERLVGLSAARRS
jgi:putative spermidine/putrescine transport system permease protein